MRQPDILGEAMWEEWLPELRWLLKYYNRDPDNYSDTVHAPSVVMRGYLRNSVFFPGRAWRAMQEIEQLLDPPEDTDEVFYSEWVQHYVNMIKPPDGRTWQECLRAMIPHLQSFTESGEAPLSGGPESKVEWNERLPNIKDMFGSYFYVYASEEEEYESHDDMLDDYLEHRTADEAAAVVRETMELLKWSFSEDDLSKILILVFGAEDRPPESNIDWLHHIVDRFTRHLYSIGYRREPGSLSAAYPSRDVRSTW